MNKRPGSERDLERLLDAEGGEFGAIYRRLARPEPPRRLDRFVLAEAARAVHGGRAPRSQRWIFGLGSAAGVVLAAGIAWQVGQQLDNRDTQPAGAREVQSPSVVPVEPISESAQLKKAEADAPMHDAGPELSIQAADKPQAPPAKRKAPIPPTAAAPPPAPMAEIAAAPEEAKELSSAAQAEPFSAESDNSAADSLSGSAGGLKQDGRPDQAADSDTGTLRSKAATSIDPDQSRAPAPTTSVLLRQNMQLAPAQWLAEIERLIREGHRQQAIENIRLFRRMNPDWQISDEMRQLAQ